MPAPDHSTTTRPCTMAVMVYNASDNNLHSLAKRRLEEIESAVVGDGVQVLVQLIGSGGVSRRYELVPSGTAHTLVAIEVDEEDAGSLGIKPFHSDQVVNSGDPEALEDFIQWGIRSWAPQRHVLILWSHGVGWKPMPNYDDTPWWHTESIVGVRAIGPSDTHGDVLSQQELAELFTAVYLDASPPRWIGYCACLMGCLEVLYGTWRTSSTNMVVCSPEKTPVGSWQQDDMLEGVALALAAQDAEGLDPQTVDERTVRKFIDASIDYCRTKGIAPELYLVALDLQHIEELAAGVDEFARACTSDCEAVVGARPRAGAAPARRRVEGDREFVDLCSIALALRHEPTVGEPVQRTSARVIGLIEQAVVKRACVGEPDARVGGISIYLPRGWAEPHSEYYRNLLWCRDHPWWERFLAHRHGILSGQE